jgi:glycosyltransferase 2 family protein
VSALRQLLRNPWVRYGLTLLLLAVVALKVHPQSLASAAHSVEPASIAAALLLTVPFLYAKALRWYLMLRAASVEATFGEATLSLLGGMGLALVTPARLGELVRVAYLRDSQKLKIGGLVMIDKGLDVLVLCALSIPGAWALLGPLPGLAFVALTLFGLMIVFNPARVQGGLVRMTSRLRRGVAERLHRVFTSLESLSPRSTAVFLALTLLSFVVILVQYGIILSNWTTPTLSLVLLSIPLVILTNVLPLTVGGLGVREGAAALLLAHYGMHASDAVLAALISFTINTALPGVVGALLVPAAIRPQPARPAEEV